MLSYSGHRLGNRPATRRAVAGTLAALSCLSLSARARADEPVSATQPKVLAEPGEVTDVIDAFDGDDVFDLQLTVGIQHTSKTANIRRESYLFNADNPGLSSGQFVASNMNVASYKETNWRLNTRADIGVYKDLALYFRLPVILSNNRSLDDLDGSSRQQHITLQGGPGEGPLFTLPFNAPQRSGIDYLAVGSDVAIMNQARDRTKPTWVFGVEGRFALGEPLHACNANPVPGQVQCAHPSDINRNGTGGEFPDPAAGTLEGQFSGSRNPGVSRGTNAIEGHTILSKRIKYIEPYGGFRALIEFQQDRSDFGGTDLKGALVNHPPLQGWMILGMQVIPWENREQFQRLTFDFRFQGAYRSEGRDYSELFDALGSSSAPSLRNPHFGQFMRNPQFDDTVRDASDPKSYRSIVDPQSQKIYFTGITNTQAYGTMQAMTSVTWQAGEYVKFQLGVGFTHEQGHFLTMDQPCNPDFKDDIGQSGPCRTSRAITGDVIQFTATGVPNPNYRPTISVPGRRFKVEDSNLWDTWLNAIFMF